LATQKCFVLQDPQTRNFDPLYFHERYIQSELHLIFAILLRLMVVVKQHRDWKHDPMGMKMLFLKRSKSSSKKDLASLSLDTNKNL
jgi:hypothetical protein